MELSFCQAELGTKTLYNKFVIFLIMNTLEEFFS